MSLRTKIIVIVFMLFVLLAGMNSVVQKTIIFPSFVDLEQHEVAENLRRILRGIDRELFFLDQTCHDWAYWTDTYTFVDTLSADYIQSNLNDDTFLNNKLNLLYIFKVDGTVAWGRAYDLENESQLTLSFLKDRKLSTAHPMISRGSGLNNEDSEIRAGVLNTEFGPLLFASRAILRSDGSGPIKGVMVMGRLFTGELVDSLREQTRIDFNITHYPEPVMTNGENNVGKVYSAPDMTYYTCENKQEINAWTTFNDVAGDPVFNISYTFPREITLKGITIIRYALFLILGAALFVLVVLLLLLETVVVKPLGKITEYASRLHAESDYKLKLDINRPDEIGRLSRTLESLVATIAERTEALESANIKLKKMSFMDGLTGIANRRQFDNHMDREWRRMIRRKSPISLIMADVDNFKHFNDQYGHLEGDKCLVKVAGTINAMTKRPTDLAARFGGEEFAIILPDTDIKGAFSLAEQIRIAIYNLHIVHDDIASADRVTLSLGVSTIAPGLKDDMGAFIRTADRMLYQAKKQGRNRTVADL